MSVDEAVGYTILVFALIGLILLAGSKDHRM